MNFLLVFAQFTVAFAVLQSANFPEGEVPNFAGLEDYLPHMARVLQDRHQAVDLSYPSARIILTLNKYYSGLDDNCHLFKGPLWPYYRSLGSYQYKFIADEFRDSFAQVQEQIPWNDLDWLEERISFTIKKCVLMNKGLTFDFLKEALVEDNSLGLFPSLLNDVYDDMCSSHQLYKDFNLQANYQALIRAAVLKQLDSLLKTHKNLLSEAFVIDFMVLMRQHYRSMNYFPEIDSVWLERALYVTARMPETARLAYVKVLLPDGGRYHRSGKNFFSALFEEMRKLNPNGMATYRFLLKVKNFSSAPLQWLLTADQQHPSKQITFLYHSLQNPLNWDELRLYMAAILPITLQNWERGLEGFTEGKFWLGYHAVFAYELLKRVERSFQGIILRLTGYHHAALIDEMKDLVTNSSIYHKADGQLKEEGLIFCAQFGLLEALKLLQSHGLKKICETTRSILLKYAIKTQQTEIAKSLWTLFRKEIWQREARECLEIAAEYAPIELFAALQELPKASDDEEDQRASPTFGENTHDNDQWKSRLLIKAINGRQFNNFDYIWKEVEPSTSFKDFQNDSEKRLELIINAFEYKVSETNVIEYLENFGSDLIFEHRSKFLLAAAVNGFQALIRKFSLYLKGEEEESDARALYAAIELAAMNGHSSTVKYLIGILGFQSSFSTLALILLETNSSDALKHTLETNFPSQLTSSMKADILIYLVNEFQQIIPKKVAPMIIKFCKMADWTASDINYIGHPSKHYSTLFGPPPSLRPDGNEIIRYSLTRLNSK